MNLDPCVSKMCKQQIVNKSDFRKWALKNHPDKGGDEILFKEINECVQRNIFCDEDVCTPEFIEEIKLKIAENERVINFFIPIIKDLKEKAIPEAEESVIFANL